LHTSYEVLYFSPVKATKREKVERLGYCGSTIDHRKFYQAFILSLLEMYAREPLPQSMPNRKTNPQASQVTWLKVQHIKHWTVVGSHTKCKFCLCMHLCFKIYHTEVHFWITSSSHTGKEATSRNVSGVYFIIKFCSLPEIYKLFGKDNFH